MDPDEAPHDLDPTFVTNDLSSDLDSVDPVTPPTIEPGRAADTNGLRALIVGIQHDEFGFDITWDDQPDLHDIDGFYRSGHGQFWVARDGDGTVVGSIGLRDCGEGLGALRKMFVAPTHRGRGPDAGPPVAQRLLDTLLAHARRTGFTAILLGTTERFEAAHRFYEKHGFARVDAATLPPTFPRMALDTRFYRLDLTA
jgi:GNAT superfamily N-acetyltransferase